MVAATTLVVLMFALALALASAQERTVEAMREGAPAVKRWGGRILIVVGIWFFALGAFAGFFARVFPVCVAPREQYAGLPLHYLFDAIPLGGAD